MAIFVSQKPLRPAVDAASVFTWPVETSNVLPDGKKNKSVVNIVLNKKAKFSTARDHSDIASTRSVLIRESGIFANHAGGTYIDRFR